MEITCRYELKEGPLQEFRYKLLQGFLQAFSADFLTFYAIFDDLLSENQFMKSVINRKRIGGEGLRKLKKQIDRNRMVFKSGGVNYNCTDAGEKFERICTACPTDNDRR